MLQWRYLRCSTNMSMKICIEFYGAKILMENLTCHICGSKKIEYFKSYEELYRVTSDSKPWYKYGNLLMCLTCGNIQKFINKKWEDEVNEIYKNYTLYYHSNTYDQLIFDQDSGLSKHRSEILVNCLLNRISNIPLSGKLLDFGCGRGALLRAFNRIRPDWLLFGCEIGEKNRIEVESLPGVKAYYSNGIEEIEDNFDFISLNHVLEHVPNPKILLSNIRNKLLPTGFLIIELPDINSNLFDILVTDHCTHFSIKTLSQLVTVCGYNIITVTDTWLPKEITIVAQPELMMNAKQYPPVTSQEIYKTKQSLLANINWLQTMKIAASDLKRKGNFGIFGTSIAAIWLDSELKNSADFFCDEDPGRVGKMFMGRPVIHPRDLYEYSNIFVPLVKEVANKVIKRLSRDLIHFYTLS